MDVPDLQNEMKYRFFFPKRITYVFSAIRDLGNMLIRSLVADHYSVAASKMVPRQNSLLHLPVAAL